MIKAVIFDMDGVLIDSEPFWQEAEIKVFKKVNINLDKKMCSKTAGLRIDKVVEYWFEKYPWKNISKKNIENEIVKEVIRLIELKGKAKKGMKKALDFVKRKNLKIAIASSSKMNIINAVVKKLDINNYFDKLCSAEFEEYGKPHPAVYLSTAEFLKVSPIECLAFEDSLNGVLSAKSARMKCICVPDEMFKDNNKIMIADEILQSLSEFNEDVFERMNN